MERPDVVRGQLEVSRDASRLAGLVVGVDRSWQNVAGLDPAVAPAFTAVLEQLRARGAVVRCAQSNIEGELVENDGTVFRKGDLVWLRDGTEHCSHSPNGCLLAVHIAGPEIAVE